MKKPDDAEKSETYVVHASQEIDIIARATASGKSFKNYTKGLESIQFQQPAITHVVEIRLTDEERRAGIGVEYLESLIREQDSDAVLAQLYILSVLAPPPPAKPRGSYSGWISFDDVIEKIGWDPRSFAQRREMHLRISEFLRFGERALISGERTVAYMDRKTKKKIDTQIRHALWRVLSISEPEQAALSEFSTPVDRAPVAVQVVISEQVAELITSPITAQYLPMGEVLGAIPGNKASGAWARVIGLALMMFWRRHREHSLSGRYQQTRRDLLTQFLPKVALPDDVFGGNDPKRGIKYWHGALCILVESGVLSNEGEAARGLDDLLSEAKGYLWQDRWLDRRVELWPSEQLRHHIEGITQLKSAGNQLKSAGK